MTQSGRTLTRWLATAGLAMLAACAQLAPTEEVRNTSELITPQAGAYQIDPAASTLHILVYRGGPMAALGHNHVISSRNVHGSIWRGATLANSGFDITVTVADLIVDDSDARAAEGSDFAAPVSADAREGTKANMLRESLLDSAHYPDISIRSVNVQGNENSPTVTAAIRIKERTQQINLPVALFATASGLRVAGAFDIRQTDFGITPLSVALGALLVQDTIKIRFELVAHAP